MIDAISHSEKILCLLTPTNFRRGGQEKNTVKIINMKLYEVLTILAHAI
jgi:hypothetical protein